MFFLSLVLVLLLVSKVLLLPFYFFKWFWLSSFFVVLNLLFSFFFLNGFSVSWEFVLFVVVIINFPLFLLWDFKKSIFAYNYLHVIDDLFFFLMLFIVDSGTIAGKKLSISNFFLKPFFLNLLLIYEKWTQKKY